MYIRMIHRELFLTRLSVLCKSSGACDAAPHSIEGLLLLFGISLVIAAEKFHCLRVSPVAFPGLPQPFDLPVYIIRYKELILLSHVPAPPFFDRFFVRSEERRVG